MALIEQTAVPGSAKNRFLDIFDNKVRQTAVKILDFYDGKSEPYVTKYLQTFRSNAMSMGMKARTRNVIKPIVDKSGMLFSGKPPTLNVYPFGDTDINDDASLAFQDRMERSQWLEFFINVDPTVRQLKTCMVLVQFDQVKDRLYFELLHPGNSAVHYTDGDIDTLIFYTGRKPGGEAVDTYRIITPALIKDIEVTSGGSETMVKEQPNVYGVVNAVVFHDTNIPRDGFWNPIPTDLLDIQEIYNLHITNAEYSIAHAELPTLFTNGQIQGSVGMNGRDEYSEDTGSKLGGRWVHTARGEGFVGGPGQAVAVETDGDSLFIEYKGPTPQIKQYDDAIKGWVRDFARDWNVTIEEDSSGFGGADSGFKLVVKEMPNAELRKKRQRMFEAGFKRMYELMLTMNEKVSLGLVPGTELFVQFPPPELPVDEKSSEEVWSKKISEGRASKISYFMQQHGQTREEAQETVKQLAEDLAFEDALLPKPEPVAVPGQETQSVNAPVDPVV